MESEPILPPTPPFRPAPPKLAKLPFAALALVMFAFLLTVSVAHITLGFDVPNTVSLGVEMLIVGLLLLFERRQSKYVEALHEYTKDWIDHVIQAEGWWERHGERGGPTDRE